MTIGEDKSVSEKTSNSDSGSEYSSCKTEELLGKRKVWIAWAFGAAIFFTLCNEAIAEITQTVGPLCMLYFSTGSLLASLVYHLS